MKVNAPSDQPEQSIVEFFASSGGIAGLVLVAMVGRSKVAEFGSDSAHAVSEKVTTPTAINRLTRFVNIFSSLFRWGRTRAVGC
jgi:hypothetical protein